MNIRSTPARPDRLRTRDILGIEVVDAGWDEALSVLVGALEARRFQRVGWLNANNANIACANDVYRKALGEFLILPDGVGVDIAAKLLYGRAFEANLNGTDFTPALLRALPGKLTVGLIGARRDSIEAAAGVLKELAPAHDYVVIHDGFFGPEKEPEILDMIARLRPDVLLAAMGVPRQEMFIAHKLTPQHCIMPIAVGALFDLINGTVPRAPEWMRRLRLEWLFRLLAEPKRLWRRYLVGNPMFLARVLRQKLGRRY